MTFCFLSLTGALETVLDEHIRSWEAVYGDQKSDRSIEERFRYVIEKAVETTGKKAVVLVDEYDKPLLEGADEYMVEHNKAVFDSKERNLDGWRVVLDKDNHT